MILIKLGEIALETVPEARGELQLIIIIASVFKCTNNTTEKLVFPQIHSTYAHGCYWCVKIKYL